MEGIFVPRCPQGGRYDGEIRAVAFGLGADGVSLRSDPDPTGYTEGCDRQVSAPAAPSGQPSAGDGGGSSPLWIAVAALACVVAGVATISALRGRRRP
jgi:hypothetical protein